MLERDGALIPD